MNVYFFLWWSIEKALFTPTDIWNHLMCTNRAFTNRMVAYFETGEKISKQCSSRFFINLSKDKCSKFRRWAEIVFLKMKIVFHIDKMHLIWRISYCRLLISSIAKIISLLACSHLFPPISSPNHIWLRLSSSMKPLVRKKSERIHILLPPTWCGSTSAAALVKYLRL